MFIVTSAGYIFFFQSFASLLIQFGTYEVVFYNPRRITCLWTMILALCAFLLLGGFITYLVLTLMKSESDFDDTWDELSTFSKIYWDNEQSSMVNAHKRNMFCICAFAIFEGVLYVIQFFCMIGFMISNPEFYITTRLPKLSKGGVDKMEYQPFKETLRKIDRKKKKKDKK